MSFQAPKSSPEQLNRAREAVTANTDNVRLEPHVCRSCFARISSRPVDGGRLYQCTNCGLEAEGASPAVACACGIKLRKPKGNGRSSKAQQDAGIRCHANPSPSPEFPSLYVASYTGKDHVPDS